MSEFSEIIAIKLLGLVGGYPTYATKNNVLQALIQKLHPLSTEIELIRIGPKGDGGYLVPNDLADIKACFSPGVADCSSFEKDCADRGMQVFLADNSVDAPAATHPNFHFIKKFIGTSTSSDFITLDDWTTASLPEYTGDLLLQMDIEGYEYESILSLSNRLLERFRIIVIEFHDLPRLWSVPFFSLASHAFEKILQTHACVHLHPNTLCGTITKDGIEIPRIMEFTFLRRDRFAKSSPATVFPHPLDCENMKGSSLTLPSCWHG